MSVATPLGQRTLVEAVPSPAYTTKIIKAGALVGDTKTLFASWDTDLSVHDNLERVRTQNLLGKASRSRVEDVLAIFRQRYLTDRSVADALAILVQTGTPASTLDRLFSFHATRADALLHDVVADFLAPRQGRGDLDVPLDAAEAFIARRVHDRQGMAWSEPTTRRVAQGVLATLRDFGVLTGVVKKRLAHVYVPIEAFAYVAFLLYRESHAAHLVTQSPEWRLFFLHPDVVERMLFEAHQERLLQYHAAGRVVRLDFPAETLPEYARALAHRAH